MNRKLNQKLRSIHSLSGVVLSLVVFLISFSGTLLVFKADYIEADLGEISLQETQHHTDLAAIAEAAETAFGAHKLRAIIFASPETGPHRVYPVSGGGAYLRENGEIIVRWAGHNRVEEWIFDLHHYLLLGTTGKIIIGLIGILLIIMTVSGIMIFWPARRTFSLSIVPASLKRRDLVPAHRNTGVLFAAPILLIALTGASMVFPQQAKTLLAGLTLSGVQATPTVLATGMEVNWPLALKRAQRQFPGAQVRGISWPQQEGQPAIVRLKQDEELHPNGRTIVRIDPNSSTILAIQDALQLPAAERLYNMFYPLHSARIGSGIAGRFYDIVIAATGLALSFLALLGAYSYLHKAGFSRKKKRRKTKH